MWISLQALRVDKMWISGVGMWITPYLPNATTTSKIFIPNTQKDSLTPAGEVGLEWRARARFGQVIPQGLRIF